jgi:hypothetical protein
MCAASVKKHRSQPHMSRIAALLLLGVMLHHIAGFYVIFQAMRYQVRKEIKRQIKQGIPPEALTVLGFSKKVKPENFYWVESHEFRYKGSMYDVVKQAENQDSIFYYCINDVQEETLFAGLGQQVKKHLTTQTSAGQSGVFENILISYAQPFILSQFLSIHFYQTVYTFQLLPYIISLLSSPIHQTDPPPEIG